MIVMTEDAIREYLNSKGWPERVWKGGSAFLIGRWKEFVDKVGMQGYTRNWLIDDYWILLEVRELIHEIGYDEKVKDADEKLQAMLTATDIKHYRRDRTSDYDFWNYGYPNNAEGFFLEQIKCHILQQPQNPQRPLQEP